MDGLGGLRVTAEPTRPEMYEIYRLVARIHPGRRWSARTTTWLGLGLIGGWVLSVVRGGDLLLGALLLPIVLVVLMVICARPVGDRWWAWRAARRWSRTWPGGLWQIRVDEAGFSTRVGGTSNSFDWSAITRVVEGDPAVVFVLAASRRGVAFVALPRAHFSLDELATVRRWVEAAPGERPWTTLRGRWASRRLRAGAPG